MRPFPTDLCLILDPAVLPGQNPENLLKEALESGVRMVQYREKSPPGREGYDAARILLETSRHHGAVFIINDYVDLALALDADGVHVGQEDLPVRIARSLVGAEKIVGASAHTVEQAVRAEEEGADYLGVGPVFASPTKQVRPPIGLGRLAEIRNSVRIPILGIGGIRASNVGAVLEAGADGVACISAILNQRNPSAAARDLLHAIRSRAVT